MYCDPLWKHCSARFHSAFRHIMCFSPTFHHHSIIPLEDSRGLYGFSIFLKGSCGVKQKDLWTSSPSSQPWLCIWQQKAELVWRAGSGSQWQWGSGKKRFRVWKLGMASTSVFTCLWPYITTTEAPKSEQGLQSMWPFLPEKYPFIYQCILSKSFGRDSSSQTWLVLSSEKQFYQPRILHLIKI